MSTLEKVAITKRGYTIYREPNEAGGHRYWSDAIGGDAVVYDSCITGLDEMAEVLRIEYSMGLCAISAPPPGPPLPWLALDLERATAWVYQNVCGQADSHLAYLSACADVDTLTAQLAEERRLLDLASDALKYALNKIAHADAITTVADTLMRYIDQPDTQPQPAPNMVRVNWVEWGSHYRADVGGTIVGWCAQYGGVWVFRTEDGKNSWRSNKAAPNTLDAAKSALLTALNGGANAQG